MPKTVKQIQEFLTKEKFDKKNLVVKIEDRLTGEYYDIDEITERDEGLEPRELYLVVNTAIDEGDGCGE